MLFADEDSLVDAYSAYLQARGISTRREVSCGRGFAADLVSKSVIWEGKLILTRDSLYQALGQVKSYQHCLKLPKIAIFGLTPEKNPKQAERIAAWLCQQHQDLSVLFCDQDPGFIAYCKKYQLIEVENVRNYETTTTSHPTSQAANQRNPDSRRNPTPARRV
jgi:hypothetical protein